jgi:ankyrin repeat protein
MATKKHPGNVKSTSNRSDNFTSAITEVFISYSRKMKMARSLISVLLLLFLAAIVVTIVYQRDIGLGKTILFCLLEVIVGLAVAFILRSRVDKSTKRKMKTVNLEFAPSLTELFSLANEQFSGQCFGQEFLELIDKELAAKARFMSRIHYVDFRPIENSRPQSIVAQKQDIPTNDSIQNKGNEVDPDTFIMAVRRREYETVKALLEAGVNPNLRSASSSPALVYPATSGAIDMVRILLKAGADPNCRGLNNGGTPLCFATDAWHVDIVKELIQAGADPNMECNDGTTALFRAVGWGNVELVRILLNSGARPDIPRNDGKTILRLAQEQLENDCGPQWCSIRGEYGGKNNREQVLQIIRAATG